MADVYISDHGNGYTTSDAVPPLVDGEYFTLHFYPDGGQELLDVRAYDSHDYAVALPPVVNNEISMQFRSAWGNLYVDVYYSGSTPPEPPTPTGRGLLWLLMAMKKNNERRLKPYVRN